MSQNTATILVCDDNPATRYTTSRVLRGAGFGVVEAATGNEAYETACAQPVDLIVLDVQLPDIDGFEVVRKLRGRGDTARIPVVHLSATFVKDVDRVHGLEVGADGYLTHPVEPPVLVATVNAFLRTRLAEDEMRRSESKFRAVFDNALNGICLLSKDMRFLEANPAMCSVLGKTREELLTRTTWDFVPQSRIEEATSNSVALAASGAFRGEFPLVRPDGRVVHLDWNISIHSGDGVYLAIVSDISERVEIEKQRKALLASEQSARAAAEQANRLKDDFLATLSHELRTPLNAIVGWAQLLSTGDIDEDDLRDGIDAIDRNAKIQTQLIQDLLDVARITSGKLRLDMRQVDPATIVESALSTVIPAADAKSIRLSKILDPAAGTILCDPSRLQQIVWNLLTNAVKFTPKGGRVTVSLRRANSHAEIEVADTGMGISADLLPYVFERFRQGDARTTRSHGGLGLGLAIVKHLVEMHGGTVQARSAGEGQGSSFVVSLPVAALRGSPGPADAPGDPASVPAAPARTTVRLDGVRVLLVDDEPDARSLMRRVLGGCGAIVRDADGVDAALTAVEEFKPHVLVSDIGMPGRDGYELIRQIRTRGHTAKRLPAVALTAFARGDDRQRALVAGFQIHVVKPVDADELIAAIASLSELSRE